MDNLVRDVANMLKDVEAVMMISEMALSGPRPNNNTCLYPLSQFETTFLQKKKKNPEVESQLCDK